MRQTLRRSCAACAKAKHSCDLRTPRCSRCEKRQVQCIYANQPLTAPEAPGRDDGGFAGPVDGLGTLTTSRFGAIDPFDSYPQTRLPRERVQRLIHSFVHKIAFQYYPLDLNPTSNPFLISWWPLALGDPALFHVSLQTACLDEELLAQKGFQGSEILMADSVALLRRKVQDPSLAVQDGTMNSVIVLAAIEFGKGNTKVSAMHVDGVKKLIDMRGGINAVRQTSPLTARMVSWVSMIVAGNPQFDTQDDLGTGDGIPPIPEWQLDSSDHSDLSDLGSIEIEYAVRNVFIRLRNALQRAQHVPLPSPQLHDLTSFVVHRLLLSVPDPTKPLPSPITECIRYATVIYMFTIQGPLYFSHAVILNMVVTRFVDSIKQLDLIASAHNDSLDTWFLAIGMVASTGTPHYQWFTNRAKTLAASLQISHWTDILMRIKSVLWLETPHGEDIFRAHWDTLNGSSQAVSPDVMVCVSPSSTYDIPPIIPAWYPDYPDYSTDESQPLSLEEKWDMDVA